MKSVDNFQKCQVNFTKSIILHMDQTVKDDAVTRGDAKMMAENRIFEKIKTSTTRNTKINNDGSAEVN